MKTRKSTNKRKKTGANKSSINVVAPIEKGNVLLNILMYLFRILFVCDVRICLSPITFILAMGLRFTLIYYYQNSSYKELFEAWLAHGFTNVKTNISNSLFDGITFGNLLKGLFLYLPYYLFLLWWYLTSIMLFITGVYSGCGTRNMEQEEDYSEFKKYAGYIQNKLRFKNYEDGMKFLRGDKD